MILRTVGIISFALGFCALTFSITLALLFIIIGGGIVFFGDVEKKDKQEAEENIKKYGDDMRANFEKRGLYTKLNNKKKD